jgi:DNA-binding NtrC family response regulator
MRRDHNAQLIGTSPEIRELREEIARVSASEAKVLVTGESGVGKELVARAIHAGSRRASNPFIAMNCAGLPETLLESELFGHVKGSFTGAYRDKAGKLELADRGTMFLDEMGEMTLRMQGLLLRFLETGELQKVGSDRASAIVNVRIVAATNRDLQALIAEGTFREDLFYRLNVIHLHVPALRARKSDIPLLIEHFLARYAQSGDHARGRTPSFSVSPRPGSGLAAAAVAEDGALRALREFEAPRLEVHPDAMEALVEYPWPGNVRELENVMERVVVRTLGDTIMPNDLPPEVRSPGGVGLRPKRERRRTVVDELYKRMREGQESFWTSVYPLFMNRDITREDVRELVRRGLKEARGNYKIVGRLFNMDSEDYKRFLNFLRRHDCQLPFKEYRS